MNTLGSVHSVSPARVPVAVVKGEHRERAVSWFILALFVATAVWGWRNRFDLGLTPGHGLGYGLGIAGGATMLVLLAYPLRKRFAALRRLGSVGLWFRLHIMLGLLGPLAVLFHARFTYSATNSGVALLSMLVVVLTGLVGWLLYRHVYGGISQRKVELQDRLGDIVASRTALEMDGDAGEDVRRQLARLEARATPASGGFVRSLIAFSTLAVTTRWIGIVLNRAIGRHFADHAAEVNWSPRDLSDHRREASHHLSIYLRAVREAAGFAVYERLFALWHVLHLPLYCFFIVTASIHVFAVHRY